MNHLPQGAPRFYRRYVAIGDSSTEGLNDPDGRGGYRGWANRLAERVAAEQGSLLYANLGVRGRCTGEIRSEQFDLALSMQPDLVSLFAGTNDLLRREYELQTVAEDLEFMMKTLRQADTTVITFTMPDLSSIMPVAKLVKSRLEELNEETRQIARRTGAVLVDFAEEPTTRDRRFWSDDRLHANADGHQRMSIALAVALGYEPPSADWNKPLPKEEEPTVVQRWANEMDWGYRHLLPWVTRRMRGRSSGDGVQPKRPDLTPV